MPPWDKDKAPPRESAKTNPIVTLETSLNNGEGLINIEVLLKEMPVTASNFLNLCHSGFYDNTYVHAAKPEEGLYLGNPNTKNKEPANAGHTDVTQGINPETTFTMLDGAEKGQVKRRARGGGMLAECKESDILNEKFSVSMVIPATGQWGDGLTRSQDTLEHSLTSRSLKKSKRNIAKNFAAPTQFHINLNDNRGLDCNRPRGPRKDVLGYDIPESGFPGYPVFANVLSGRGLAQHVGDAPIDIMSRPEKAVEIRSCTVRVQEGQPKLWDDVEVVSRKEIDTWKGQILVKQTLDENW
jgi:cyclophilin family peptidyl-prolyl cis-trans isomerase